jgi:hypothetical protein
MMTSERRVAMMIPQKEHLRSGAAHITSAAGLLQLSVLLLL